jgi:outer membrane protein assembly factor BamA
MVVARILLVLACCFGLNQQTTAQPLQKVERLIEKAYKILEGDSSKPRKVYFAAIPIWGIYPETGWRLGLSNVVFFNMHQDSITRPSLLRLNLQYTQNGQYSIKPFSDVFSKDNNWNLRAFFNHTYFNEYYFGIGNQAPKENRELYFFKLNQFDLRLTRKFGKHVYVGAQVHSEKMYNMDYREPASNLNKPQTPGGQGSFTAGAGLVLAYDNRNKIYYPTQGVYAEVSNVLNTAALNSGFNFYVTQVDIRKYIHLKKMNVVALQAFGRFIDGQAPFRQLSTMGNDMMMRGYYNGRYRDNHLFCLQAELRQTIWGPVGLAVFGGVGNVGSNLNNLMQHIKPNYGAGLRGIAFRKEHINIRIDYGIGHSGISGFYFTMGEAF